MKVYYVNSDLGGCYYVRCLIPLVNNGWDGDKTSIRAENYPAPTRAKASIDADVVVFHRPDKKDRADVAKMLKEMGKKIVYDNDDTYKGQDDMKLGALLQPKTDLLDNFIKDIADLVTCSTEYLADEYRQITDKPVVVIPNLVDPDDWDTPLRNEGNKVRIGFVGSVALNNDFKHFRDIIKTLDDRGDCTLVLYSLPPIDYENNPKITELYKPETDFWTSLKNVEWQTFTDFEDYFETLNELRLDMMLIPRSDDYFNRCKSNLKFLEASMLEIPVIAQGFKDGKSPYQGVEDSKYMTICTEIDEWLPAIEKLINDKELRLKQGKETKEYVLKNYNAHERAKEWEKTYQQLLD